MRFDDSNLYIHLYLTTRCSRASPFVFFKPLPAFYERITLWSPNVFCNSLLLIITALNERNCIHQFLSGCTSGKIGTSALFQTIFPAPPPFLRFACAFVKGSVDTPKFCYVCSYGTQLVTRLDQRVSLTAAAL